jgi:hypothetical protein
VPPDLTGRPREVQCFQKRRRPRSALIRN